MIISAVKAHILSMNKISRENTVYSSLYPHIIVQVMSNVHDYGNVGVGVRVYVCGVIYI